MTVNPSYRSGVLYNNTFEEKVEKSSASIPINSAHNSETSKSRELASKELSYATRATAMAQILVGSDLKPNMTQKDYVARLIKQGKIPNKHFFIEKNEYGSNSHITEVNSKGERIKEVRFFDDGNIGCSFYNPKTQKRYKSLETLNGELHIGINDPQTGEPICDEKYLADGSLENCAIYKKCEKIDPSINYENRSDYHKINGDYYKIYGTTFSTES